MTIAPLVQRVSARPDVQVTLPNGAVYSAARGTPISAFFESAGVAEVPKQGVLTAALIDNDLRELNFEVTSDCSAQPIYLSDSDGGRIYRRSLVFVLVAAAAQCFPNVKIAVENSLTVGGFYCRVANRNPLTLDELAQLKTVMSEIINANEPILRREVKLSQAIEEFTRRDADDKLRLLEYRDKDYLTLYRLRGVYDYFYGYMLPSTRSLKLFDIQPTHGGDGFLLRYPRPETPEHLLDVGEIPQIERVFQETDEWLRIMGLEDMGHLNRAIQHDRLREIILIAEALHSRRIAEIAAEIAERYLLGTRLVLIAGPSSAGKTTFSKRLAVQLMAHGLRPYTLAMDNYFVDRDATPRDENGEYDFEALEALNRTRLGADLIQLMNRETVQLPLFDFRAGHSKPGDVVQLRENSVIIAEGIHGLNPGLVPQIGSDRVYRIYVSALTALNMDRHNRIPTTDVRLLRRMVRDYSHRGYSASETLNRWESVRRGEKRNIFPHQDNADAMFNSSLPYELAVLRPFAEPLLRQIDRDSPRYAEAKRLLAFLGWVRPVTPEGVPGESLLREFVGGSTFEHYTPGV
jgi:uridine kinase